MDKCPFCETREILKKISALIETIPQIDSDHYDDQIAKLSNMVDNTVSWFQCYCDDESEK